MYYSVDRVLDDKAVLVGDDESIAEVKLPALAAGVKAGDVYECWDGAYTFSPEMTETRKNEASRLLSSLLGNARN